MMPLAAMIVIGEVLRMPAAMRRAETDSTLVRGFTRSISPRGLGDERLESPLAELRHFLACGGANEPVVGGAVHQVPACAHR